VPQVERIAPRAARGAEGRIRIGYLSSDFRNHATMHLMRACSSTMTVSGSRCSPMITAPGYF